MAFDNTYDDHLLRGSDIEKNRIKTINPTKTIYYGYVIDNEDEFDGGRLRVKVPELDKSIDDTSPQLLAFPLLSKVGDNVLPKKGESVIIIIADIAKPYGDRFWIGPVVSQFQNIGTDQYINALSLTKKASVSPLSAISKIPNAEGVFPVNNKDDKEGLTTIGRDNTEVKHRKNKVVVKAGKHITDNPTQKNEKNPSYLQNLLSEDNDLSYSSLIADVILLLSHNGNFLPKGGDELTKEDYDNIISKGYSLVKGEILVSLLKKMLLLIVTHTHPYNNLEISKELSLTKELLEFNFDTLISNNHKIN